MSESLNTCTSSTSSQEKEQVSTNMTDTTIDVHDEAILALADELELDMEKSATPEQDTSESGAAPPQADEEMIATTGQVVEHVVATKGVDQCSPSAPQWTPVNPSPRPTTGGKGIKQAGGNYLGPSEKALSLPQDDSENATVGDPASSEGTEQGDKAPSSAAAAGENATPSSPQGDEQVTDHPKTGGKGPMVRAPFKLETLKTETAERMRNHLAAAGLDTKGTKDQLIVRILLSDNELDIPTYALRCSILLDTIWNLRQLKDRCEELGVPEADRKTSSKTKLVQLLLLAEKDQGIVFADSDNLPKTSAWSVPKGKVPKPKASTSSTPAKSATKRKHGDSTDATDDEGPDTKRPKSDESVSPNSIEDSVSTPRPSTPRPKKAPKKRQPKSKIESPHDDNNINVGTNPQAGSSTCATKKNKRKRTGDDEADQDGHISSKRMKEEDSSIVAAAASKKVPTAQLVKEAMRNKKRKEICEDNISINDVFYSQDLFENQPVPVGVVQSALHVLTGCANDGDAANVFQHRSTLPKYKAYCQQDIDDRTDEDEVWLASQKYYEPYEMEAVRAEIGEEFSEAWNPSEETDGVSLRDYFKFLKEPEADEFLSKEKKEDARRLVFFGMKREHIEIADPRFKEYRTLREF